MRVLTCKLPQTLDIPSILSQWSFRSIREKRVHVMRTYNIERAHSLFMSIEIFDIYMYICSYLAFRVPVFPVYFGKSIENNTLYTQGIREFMFLPAVCVFNVSTFSMLVRACA